MTAPATPDRPPLFVPVGDNHARPFGMSASARAEAIAAQAGMDVAVQPDPGRATIYGNLAFMWDPAWNIALLGSPGTVLVKDGRAVLAHLAAGADPTALLTAMRNDALYEGALDRIDADEAELSYKELRKRERPFVVPLSVETCEAAERAAYDASYKGVTDLLTLYLWRRPAFHLTRWAAEAGLKPNFVTLVGALLCLATFFLWLGGYYWIGIATGFGFMVLDTVDGKLARCTGQSSKWGNVFDHGVDLLHPPFWWWAWAEGLNTVGMPLERVYELLVIGAIIAGYIAQRIIEGVFLARFKMDIHVWRPADSRFRLITARRNPNMLILLVSLLFGRPDIGLQAVALWTMLSLIFHAVRLAQANDRRRRGRPIVSWLA